MSEDSSSDEEWGAPADKLPVGANLGQKCWECGKTFQRIENLISHYKSHDVQATCHICQVTFRRMTSLSTHLDNAHSPFCKMCNKRFSNVWEFNKHAEAHYIKKVPSERTPSNSCITIVQDKKHDNSDNGLIDAEMAPLSFSEDAPPSEGLTPVVQDHTYISSCGNVTHQLTTQQSTDMVSETRPLESDEINHEQLETFADHIDYTMGEDDFEDNNMGSTYENTDDSASSQDDDRGMSLNDEDGRPSDVQGDEMLGCVEEQSVEDATSEFLQSQSIDSCPDDPASDSGSSSSLTGSSSDPSLAHEHSSRAPAAPPSVSTTMCTVCGRGPFRNVKVHLLHCPGKMVVSGKSSRFYCSLCKGHFATEALLQEHQSRWYSCSLCCQVYRYLNSYKNHICPAGRQSSIQTTVLFCSRSMPKSCNICKAFFSTQDSLLNHVMKAHSSRFTTKVCFVTNPTFLTVEKVTPVSATVAQFVRDVMVSSRAVTCQSVISGKPSVSQSHAGSLCTVVSSRPFSPSLSPSHPGLAPLTSRLVNGGATKFVVVQQTPSTVNQVVPQKSTTNPPVTVMTQSQPRILSPQKITLEPSLLKKPLTSSSSPVRPLRPVLMAVPTTAVRSETAGALGQMTNQPAGQLRAPVSVSVSGTNKTPATVAADSVSPRKPLNIVALFKNDSKEVALQKRMNTSWRSKAPYPCRQCGAVSRQPSLVISHRYLHRGRRSHRCQCGRSFKHRLHLLRHCVQHAEATSYICVSCGETFRGAQLLAKHMKGNSRKSFSSGRTWKHRARRKCSMPFSCDCGQLFFRPSAYIWHQLNNRRKAKHQKKSSNCKKY